MRYSWGSCEKSLAHGVIIREGILFQEFDWIYAEDHIFKENLIPSIASTLTSRNLMLQSD